ncbi:MAG: site-2 protease family protein [Pseudomonadota bacterium]
MFGRQITLFRLLGFRVGIDWSWLVLAILITWTLAVGFFPTLFPDLEATTYWSMGIVGALGLFFSIVFHELSHSLVSRRFDMPIRGITLFIFGGVAEMEGEPTSPKAEFLMAIAGPIASMVLSGGFLLVGLLGDRIGWPVAVVGVLSYLYWVNGLLALFNLVPAFPLDGGRVLRAALWGWKKDYRWATKIASNTGSFFGLLLIALGIVSFVTGNFVGGFWWFLLGLFVRFAASSSYHQVIVRESLSGVPISAVMTSNPIVVPPSLTVAELVEEYFYRYHHKMFPVMENGRFMGVVNLRNVQGLPRASWATARTAEVLEPPSEKTVVSLRLDAMTVLSWMQKTGNGRLCVTDGDRLAGVVTRKDVLDLLALRLALEEETHGPAPGWGRS